MALKNVSALESGRGSGRDRTAEIERLRAKMQRLQQQGVPARSLATHPGLAGLVELRAGMAYGVDNNTLALLMLAGPSAAGEWATVIGVPDFGAEAAAELGVRLERTILVPEPGESWLEAVAALVDVTGLVVVRPPDRVPERTTERIGARLRTRGAALVALGAPGTWPRAEAHLAVVEPRWAGLGRGEGFLSEHELVVEVRRGAGGRAIRRGTLWLGERGPSVAPAGAREMTGLADGQAEVHETVRYEAAG